MNTTLDQFLHAVHARIPDLRTEVDPGLQPSAPSWVDLMKGEKKATIEYRPKLGFGLYPLATAGYGTGPREVYRALAPLLTRIEKYFAASKSDLLSLRDVRELCSVTQEQLATITGKNQSAISKLESREDLLMTTLVEFVEALGGTVDITVHCDEFDVPLYVQRTQRGDIADTADEQKSKSAEPVMSAAAHDLKGDSAAAKTSDMFQQLVGRVLLDPTTVIRPKAEQPALRAADREFRWAFELGPRIGRVVLSAYQSKQQLLVEPRFISAAQTYWIYFVDKQSGTLAPWPSQQQIGIQLTTRRKWLDISLDIISTSEPVIVNLAANN